MNEVYAAIFIDAIIVKVRDGQVANRPVYAAIGVSLAGEKDVLGLWAGAGGEGATFSDERADRPPQLRCEGHLLRGLRRPQGRGGGRRERVAADHGPDVHHRT